MDQAPQFEMHVILGLIAKFNHNRAKVYHLHIVGPVSLNIKAISNHLSARKRERELNSELTHGFLCTDRAKQTTLLPK